MQASNRIIINTLAQYIRTILNLVLSLYSSRLVLDILGVDDFGIYSLVAGVVSMLSFLTNSLVTSTQRFLSVYQGKGEIQKLKSVFSNSLLLHIVLGLLILICLEICTPFLFNGFLNIPEGRVHAASLVYQQVVLMVYVSFIMAPYRALLVSRENIIYTSIIDVVDGALKVVLVLILPFVSFDKLVAYGWIMFIIRVFDLLAFSIYTHLKYEECIVPKLQYFNKSYIKELSSYTGWMIYSSACIALRTQGFAIVLNKALGAVINAAYGIGSQISGMVSFVSSSFNSAIAPQLMAAEGGGNRQQMWMLAKMESKFSFLLLSMVGIPTMFEMQALLEIWLKDVPNFSMMFGCMFLTMQIVDMLTTGLGTANRAMGNVGLYTFITCTPKLFALPLCYMFLKFGAPLYVSCLIMVIIEAFSMLMRIPMIIKVRGFDLLDYIKEVFLKSLIPLVSSILLCFIICHFFDFKLRFFLTYIVSISAFGISVYYFSLNNSEKNKVDSIISDVKRRFIK